MDTETLPPHRAERNRPGSRCDLDLVGRPVPRSYDDREGALLPQSHDDISRARRMLRAVLAEATLFRRLSVGQRDRLAEAFQTFAVPRDRMVMSQGGTGSDFYLVLDGRLFVAMVAPDGRQVGFFSLTRASYFGELSAIDRRAQGVTVTAETPCLLACLPAATFRAWVESAPEVATALAFDMSQRTRALTERVFGLVAYDVATRLRQLLCQIAVEAGELHVGGTLNPAPTHEMLASLVGANREAVSRELSRLARQGVIETGRQRIVIRDVAALGAGL